MRLVLDWDGTVTEPDTLGVVVERFGDLELWRRTGREMGRTLSHDEAVAEGFRSVRAPLEEVREHVLARVRVRPGFRELVERHRPLIVSSGFRELIEPVLAREGLRADVDVELVANRVEARPDGWRAVFEREACEHCAEACKRALLPDGEVVYVGDGYSDRCAALAASRVFARDGLASYLSERGAAFEPFDDLHDVLHALG